jgi:hypothetical protein
MAPVSLRVSRKFAQATEPRQKSFSQKSGEISINHDFGSLAGFVTVLSPGREDMALNPNQAQRRVFGGFHLTGCVPPSAPFPRLEGLSAYFWKDSVAFIGSRNHGRIA